MLNLFRQGGFIKIIMGAVVVLIMAAFAFDFRGGVGPAKPECVVRVDESCIGVKDLNVLTRLVGAPGMSNNQLRKSGFTQYAVNALVERELLLKEARRLGVSVSEEEVDDELYLGRVHFSWPVDAPLPQALFQGVPFPKAGANEMIAYIRVRNTKTNAFDFDVYKRQVQNLLRMSPKEFKRQQADEITAWRVRQLVTAPVRVSEEEAFFAFEQQQSKITARVAEARNDWFERFATRVDEAAARAYLEANEAEVNAKWDSVKDKWVAGCPLVQEIMINYPAGADAEQRAQAAEQLQAASTMLAKGVSFERVARAVSQGEHAAVGGHMGCLHEGSNAVAADQLQVVNALSDGETSDIFETPRGVHIMKRSATLAADTTESLGKAHVARTLAVEAQGRETARAFAQRVIADVKAGKELKEAVDAAREDVVAKSVGQADPLFAAAMDSVDAPSVDISRPVSRGTPVVMGLKDPAATNAMFALEPDAVLAEPQETHLGWAVLQLKEKDEAKRETFEEDKQELIRTLSDQKRAVVLADYIKRLREQAKRLEIDPRYLGTAPQGDSESPADNNG